MVIRFVLCAFSVCLISACGGGTSSGKSVSSPSNSSSSLSSQMASSQSSAVLIRQKISAEEANFFQEAGLWVSFTKVDMRNRTPQNNIEKPFIESRLQETSVNNYVFAPQSSGLTLGSCIRTLEPTQVNDGFRNMLFNSLPIGSEFYCVTEDSLYKETNGSYTVEYRCGEDLLATTQLVKISSLPKFQDLGLTLSSAQIQQPTCVNWITSKFEVWSVDANGNDIERELSAAMSNGIQLRVGTDNDSVVINFTNPGILQIGTYDIVPFDLNGVVAKTASANAGVDPVPGIHFFAEQGELQIDRIEPLRLSGSFEIHGANNESLTGSFLFDVSEYFSD